MVHTAVRAERSSAGRRMAVDVGIAAALCAAAFLVGTRYMATVFDGGGQPRFYQDQFGAAVMEACAGRYVNPDSDRLPALKAFLDLRADAFDCAQLAGVGITPLMPMQVAFRYQESTVAFVWKLTGVSWRRLAPLHGLFFAATVGLAYGVFRIAMGRVLAAGAAAALIVSTIHLIYLPHLRDYSKAPFILALTLVLGLMVARAMSARRLVALSALYGVLVAVGVGFRNDLLIALPLFVTTIAVFLPGGWRARPLVRIAALAACLAAFVAAMWPMRSIYATGGGNSMQHVVVLGLMSPFNDALGVSNGGLYEWGYDFKDEFAHATISSFATRVHGERDFLPLYGATYDRTASEYLKTIAATFPADMVVRVVAAIRKVLELPYNTTSLQPPTFVSNATVIRGYHLREQALRAVAAWWPWAIAAGLAMLSVADLRVAIFLTFIVLYFAAYPVLQFHERHFFHLEFVAWFMLGLVAQRAVDAVVAVRAGGPRGLALARRPEWRSRVIWAVAIWVGAIAGLAGTVAVLRVVQQRQVRALLDRYVALPMEPLDRAAAPLGPDRVTMVGPAYASAYETASTTPAVASEYIVAEFRGGGCEALKLDMTMRYRFIDRANDFSRTMQVRPPLETGAATRVFFPAYFHAPDAGEASSYGLAGIELPAPEASCLSALYRVRAVDGLPLLLNLTLSPHWRDAALYHTIDGIEARRDPDALPDVYTFPPQLPVTRSLLARAVEPIRDEDLARRADVLRTGAGGWTVHGAGGIGGKGRFLYLAEAKARPLHRGGFAMVRGRVDEGGGLSFGLVAGGRWVAQLPITRTGDFVAIVQVPEDGVYSVVLANNLSGSSLRNDATISAMGVLAAS